MGGAGRERPMRGGGVGWQPWGPIPSPILSASLKPVKSELRVEAAATGAAGESTGGGTGSHCQGCPGKTCNPTAESSELLVMFDLKGGKVQFIARFPCWEAALTLSPSG